MKALITDMRHGSAAEEERVFREAGIELDTTYCNNEEDLIRNGKGAVGFLVSYANVTRHVMEELPDLKIIVKYGIGVDTIDLAAASELGKYVVNVPDYCSEEVATHAFALILSGLRMIPLFSTELRNGVWVAQPEGKIVYRPSTVRLGLVSFGRIAQKLAELARPMFKEVLYFDPYVAQTTEDHTGARPVGSIEELFEQSTVVSVHAPLNDETRGLVGREAISRGRGVILVNTGRGEVIEKEAVIEGLEQGWLSFFGADVFWQEPPAFDDPATAAFLNNSRVVITPHVAWCSSVSAKEVRRRAAEEVVRAARQQVPLNVVNKDVLKERKAR